MNEIPFEWEIETESSDIDLQRSLSIVRYTTNTNYNRKELQDKFSKFKLNYGNDFGCIKCKDHDNHVHVMFGKLGEKTLRGLSGDKNEPILQRYRFRKVIISTMHVEHFPDKDNKLNLIVFGGGKNQNELFTAYSVLFGIREISQMGFDEKQMRKMCFQGYVDKLSNIKFDPVTVKKFGNVQSAEYQALRKQLIDPRAEKIKEIIDNNEIKVQKFKSYIVTSYTQLKQNHTVNFTAHIDGKIVLEFPMLVWNKSIDHEELEEHFFCFARKIYSEIINPSIYLDNSKKQLGLFDF